MQRSISYRNPNKRSSTSRPRPFPSQAKEACARLLLLGWLGGLRLCLSSDLLRSVLTLLTEFTGWLDDLVGEVVLLSVGEGRVGAKVKEGWMAGFSASPMGVPSRTESHFFELASTTTRQRKRKTTHSHKTVLGLKLLLALLVVVDHTETLRRSTSELGLQAEDDNSGLLGLVERSELLGQLISGQVGSGRVEDRKDELFTVEESVGDELGGSEGDWAGGILGSVDGLAPSDAVCRSLDPALSISTSMSTLNPIHVELLIVRHTCRCRTSK